jgi:hypothetical protein
MRKHIFLILLRKTALLIAILFTLSRCADEALVSDDIAPATAPGLAATSASDVIDCSMCTYIVPDKTHVIDGQALGLQPGSIIGLSASISYGNLLFKNIVGTEDNPIIIRNCGGTASINGTGLSFALKTENSKYFRITGGNASGTYGIRITGGNLGITLDKLSTNFRVDHVEISDQGFAGIMAKTDPTCDDATIRGNFTMKNVYFNDNYIHDTGGEAFYIGNSFYAKGKSTSCGVRLPHEIHYLKVNNNIVKNCGWDGIQVGCATRGARIYANTVENYGTANRPDQRNGIQIGEGTGGICYGNLVRNGTGNGMIVMGLGDNVIYNNVIEGAGAAGVFCDERYTPGPGFKFINNTIVNSQSDGIRIYADRVPMNVIVNNIIANPGTYSLYSYPRKPEDAFVYRLSNDVKIDMSNNYFTTSAEPVMFISLSTANYRLQAGSPVIDMGRDISAYSILTDFYKKTRLKGLAYDIGAVEY